MVRRGLERLEADSSAADPADEEFFRLAGRDLLPRETRDYVPQLLAAAAIGADPERFGFRRPEGSLLAFDSVLVRRSIDLGSAARALGVDRRSITELNPHFIRGATPPTGPSWVRVPVGLGDSLAGKLSTIPTVARPLSTRPYTRIRVRRGDTVESIATRAGVSAEALRRSNARPRAYPLRPGQVLWVRAGADL
jgi:membrane-bound lytic murein transglycosylase D